MCSTDGMADVWRETPRKARKRHTCDECNRPIPAGVRYVECSGISEDREPFRLHVHAECMALWKRVHEKLCKGKGGILIGGLWEELTQDGFQTPETWSYRMRYQQIQQKYSEAPL